MIKLLLLVALAWFAWQMLTAKPKRRPLPSVADEAEARAILGVPAGADAEAIRAAHRRLVAQVHPDRGGSAELARRVNGARDLLLKR